MSMHNQLEQKLSSLSLTNSSHTVCTAAMQRYLYIHCISPAWQSLAILVAQLVEYRPRNLVVTDLTTVLGSVPCSSIVYVLQMM